MKTEPSVRRHLCLWLPEPLPATESEQQDTHQRNIDRKKRESERLKAFALWCQQFSPRVAIEREPGERSLPGSTLVLEITGLAPHFGGEEGLTQKVAHQLCNRGVAAHLGVADSIGAAWALAHFGHTSTHPCNDLPDTSSITLHSLAPQISLLDALHALPVVSLRLEMPTVELLASLGIHSVGQILALPRKQLSARFGKNILYRIDQASGTLDEVLRVIPPPEPIATDWSLEFPTADRSILKRIFRKLIDRLQMLLINRSQIPLGIVCRLTLQDRTEEQLAVSLYQACGDVPHLDELLELRLERMIFSSPVSEVALTVTDISQQEHHQPTWFNIEQGESGGNYTTTSNLPVNPFTAPLHRCLERITSRLGTGGVVQPRWTQDPIPERAIRFHPRINATGKFKKKLSRKSLLLRPLWLLRRPKRIRILASDPQNLPHTFAYLGHHHTIEILEGPERIEASWHGRARPQHILRDYYRAETSALRRFWIFQRHQDSLWFLHGEFD